MAKVYVSGGGGSRRDDKVVRTAGVDGLYRWWLRRVWDPAGTLAAFIMLNPSTADGTQDDPTIRRCVDFAKRWGHGKLLVVNLFAYRATDPGRLATAPDPVGPLNDHELQGVAMAANVIVAAWGDLDRLSIPKGRDVAVWRLLRHATTPVQCLGLTQRGHPRHPLFVRGDTELRAYPGPKDKGEG